MDETTKQLDDLNADPKNPRTMSKQDAEALSNSLNKFGDLGAVVFNLRTKQLVGGHQRIEMMKRLPQQKRIQITHNFGAPDDTGTVAMGYIWVGNKSFAYREVDWDEPTQRAANIAANRISGEFDLALLAEIDYELSQLENGADLLKLTGQTEDEISNLLDSVGALGESAPEEDEPPAVDDNNPPASKLGEIYQLGKHKLLCGDATDFGLVSDLLDGADISMVFTDPPYGISYADMKGKYDPIANDGKDPTKVITDAYSVLDITNKTPVYMCCDWRSLDYMRKAFASLGVEEKALIVWDKKIGVQNLDKYFKQHELILYGGPYGGQKTLRGDVWEIARESDPDHPTPKPTELCRIAIQDSSLQGGAVADFFGGSGSTLIAAEQTNRVCYMVELDPKYCDVIRKRYAKLIGQEENWQNLTPVIQPASENVESQNEAPVAQTDARPY